MKRRGGSGMGRGWVLGEGAGGGVRAVDNGRER
jgi:hypothetical protein